VKALKVILIVVAVLVVLLILLVGAGVFFTDRYLQSSAFKDRVLKTAHDELGADVRIDEMHASLFSGVALRGVTIGNPPGFSNNLVTADAFILRYRLLPLLSRRVEIEQLSLDKPVITLAQNENGEWNYSKIGPKENEAKHAPAAPPSATPAKSENASPAKPGKAVPVDIVLSKLALTQGSLSMVSASNKPLVTVDGINLSSSVKLTDNKLSGTGKAGIDKINLSDKLIVEKARTSVTLGADEVKLSSLEGQLGDGKISGDVTVNYSTGLEYIVNVQLKDSDVAKLLQQAGAKPVTTGKLDVTTALQGTGGLPTIIGTGRVEIVNGKFMEIPLLNLLATLLQVNVLRNINFTQFLVEFSISNNVMQTPVIRLVAPGVQITGKGTVSLDKYTLNHDMTLTFAKGVLNNAPEIAVLFASQPDGSLTLDFKVTGPYNSPKTDLTKRLAQSLGPKLLQRGLQELLP
jgi:uncharacterized protein involved in outer membrane biogenesis